MRLLTIGMLILAIGCAGAPPQASEDHPEPEARIQPRGPESEKDQGERAHAEALLAAARNADTRAALALVTRRVAVEAEAVHGSVADWLSVVGACDWALDLVYTREGAGGRFLTAKARARDSEFEIGWFFVREGGLLRLDNLLSRGALVPGLNPAIGGSRSNVLRAFWGYYGALTGLAPEFLPDQPAQAPTMSRRLRLAAWRGSLAPTLRDRLVAAGPESARNSVPQFLDSMGALLAQYHLPEVRDVDLKQGRLVVLFTPTASARQAGAEHFLLEYRSAWTHGMQVLVSEAAYAGSAS